MKQIKNFALSLLSIVLCFGLFTSTPGFGSIISYAAHETSKSSKTFKLTVQAGEGGAITVGSSGKYSADTVVELGAMPYDGYVFTGWQTSDGGSFDDERFPETVFLMPANSTTISATFEPIDLDSDKDNIPDYFEYIIGTDPLNADTDEDSLPDGYEIKRTGTNPLLADSDGNGIPDGEEDFDDDELINSMEYTLGTRPDRMDTDSDGLSDGDEVNSYGTDPLTFDTDEDGLTDSEELTLGLDPTNPVTDQTTPDALRTFYQELATDGINDALLSAENQLIPSISGNVPGLISNRLVLEASFLDIFNENPALVSSLIDVFTTYEIPLTLTFDYSRLLSNYEGDIHNLVIFKYEEDELHLISTIIDEENQTLYGEILGEGTYFVMDLDMFLISIGIDVFSNVEEPDVDSITSSIIDTEIVPLESEVEPLESEVNPLEAKVEPLESEVTPQEAEVEPLEAETEPLNTAPHKSKITSPESEVISLESGIEESEMLEESQLSDESNVNDDGWILLDDYQVIQLPEPLSEENDTDMDGFIDSEELLHSYEIDKTPFIDHLLEIHSIPEDLYTGETSVTVWSYLSSPILSDTDFDGINDQDESAANLRNNNFAGTIHGYSDSGFGKVNFTMDYRYFFNSNTVYNPNLSVISSLFATDIYDDDKSTDNVHLQITSGTTRKGSKATGLLQTFGMTDTATYHVTNSSVDTDDRTQFSIGHRLVEYNGQKREIIAVIIRGTNGTVEEWSSNFDVGANVTNYYNAVGQNHPDWKNKNNHKGFDVTANRVIDKINQYVSQTSLDPGAQKVIWIMGHSRGAAIANIVGTYYEDSSQFISFTYAYATPNMTTQSNAGNYRSIYNIINSDDFVTEVAPSAWAFRKFGRTYSKSISANYEDTRLLPIGGYQAGTWEHLVGYDYDDYGGLPALISALSTIAGSRNDLYKYTCRCHGDNTSNNITITNYGMSQSSRESAIAKIPLRAQKYAKITRYNGWGPIGWDFEVCQTPAYFMQLIASTMGDEIDAVRFAVELDIASRYENAKSELKKATGVILGILPVGGFTNFGGLMHPHYPESYYLLATKFTANNY